MSIESKGRDAKRPGGSATAANDSGEFLARDLEALRRITARDLPDLQTTARRAQARADSREGFLMNAIEKITRRPLWATAAAGAAVAIALLFIPFSYERTVGQDVSIMLAGAPGDPAGGDVRAVADALRSATSAERIRVEAGNTMALNARLPGRSRAEATAMARAFTAQLAARGIQASFAVTPWTEKATGNVYAQVSNHWREIRVETQGRSEEEIEREVAAQLEQMGFTNPEVSFSRSGDGTQLGIRAGDSGEQLEARVERRVEGGNGEEPPVEVALPDFSDLEGLPDDQVRAEVERRLRERGIEAEVTVQNGRIEIRARKEVHR